MAEKANTVTVRVLGENYTLKASQDPQELIDIAAYVDARAEELAKVFPRLSAARLAVMTAINIAGELIKLRESQEPAPVPADPIEHQEEVRRRLSLLIAAVEEQIEKG